MYGLAFSPDGELLATGSYDKTVRLWDVDSRTEVTDPFVADNDQHVLATAFSPDGATLAVVTENRVGLWDVASRPQVSKLSDADVRDVAFSKDGRTMATVGSDLQVWDVASRDSFAQRFTDAYGLAFSPDNRTIATGTMEGKVWLYLLPAT